MEQITASKKPSVGKVAASASNEAAVWGRLIDPADTELSPEAARYILALRFPQADLDRMRELAEKAREGTLAGGESVELDVYEQVGHTLSLMKSKARKSLKQVRKVS